MENKLNEILSEFWEWTDCYNDLDKIWTTKNKLKTSFFEGMRVSRMFHSRVKKIKKMVLRIVEVGAIIVTPWK